MLLVTLVGMKEALARSYGSPQKDAQHLEVSMRMAGHQMLLTLGDSTSRVLPVERDGDTYRIQFEKEFGFHPDDVAVVIDSVIFATQVAKNYMVEFENCETGQVVHMYEVGETSKANVLACRGRGQPIGCYNLLVTILDSDVADYAEPTLESQQAAANYDDIYRLIILLILVVIILSSVIVFMLRRKRESTSDPNMIPIGDYRFYKRKMELWFGDKRIELTSKECDLLQLLCDSTNDTVERETILKMVWGDEGDYVGRTLDVFISKLRKKLESDSNVKIVNVRGIGYKLVLND